MVNTENNLILFLAAEERELYQSVSQFSHSVVSDSLRPLNHRMSRLPGYHQLPKFTQTHVHRICVAIQPSHPLSSPSPPAPNAPLASGSFPMSQLFAWGGQSIGVSASASVLPMNIQDWSPLEWTGWISLQSKGLSRVFSNATAQKHQFWSDWLPSKNLQAINAGEGMEKREPSCIAGVNVNWYSHYRRWYGDALKN